MPARLTLLSIALALCAITAHADPLTVKAPAGKLHGKLLNESKVRAFQGIPYAASPTGDLRWKAPQPAPKWKGELQANQYGHRCESAEAAFDMAFQDSGPSEDCLFLNVYTPAGARPGAKLPVLFWIHGGGYQSGSSSEPRHNGDFLPTKDVILVTINYRLGVFGFLALPELSAEQGGSSGNYGLMDMVSALTWVKTNIASFGGDPANVTIFGESAGSFAVSTLMAAPSAQGLFAKAIGESGGALSSKGRAVETQAERAPEEEAWLKSTGAQNLAELRAMPVDKILDTFKKKGALEFGEVTDGKFLPETVASLYAAGKQAKIPLLAGFNHDEGSFLSNGMTADKWKIMGNERFTDKAALFFKLYPGTNDTEAVKSAVDFGGDQFIAFGTWKWMEIDRQTGDKTIYRYKMDLPAPPSKFHPGFYAFHSDDIEYIFGTLDTRPGANWRPEDRKLSQEMMDYWTDFAKKGDPNGPGLPEWPVYGAGDPVLHLDATITVRNDENRSRYEWWLSSEKKPTP